MLEQEDFDDEPFPGETRDTKRQVAPPPVQAPPVQKAEPTSATTTSAQSDEEGLFPGEREEQKRIAALLASDPATLSEPLWQTIWRDVFSIVWKLVHILLPFSIFLNRRSKELRNWDLWGPLVFSFLLGFVVSLGVDADRALVFTVTITVLWAGGIIVSVNAILLGGHMSVFASVCVIGYCLAPLDAAAIACLFWDSTIFRLAVVGSAYLWSIFASWGFIVAMMPPDKTGRGILVAYPVFLFYLFVSWVIIVSNDVI